MKDSYSISFPFYGAVGIAVFLISMIMLSLGREPWVTWFYSFAWWSYILTADALVLRLSGTSLLKRGLFPFLGLVVFSVCVWLVFEAYNLVLQNWFYMGVPANDSERWLGYFIAFGTVLPGLFETKDLLEALGLFRAKTFASFKVPNAWLGASLVLGMLSLVLPLLWPNYLFPLVWGAFIFLLEPLLYGVGGPSLLRLAEEKGLKEFYLLLISGLVCGFLWELWNYWSGAKWIYNIPYVHFLQLGEMPLLGFLGFPPFAVECYLIIAAFGLLWNKLNRIWHGFLVLLSLCWMAVMFRAIDTHTVWLFR